MLTNSIRRKLLFGLSLVSLILITLMMGGAYILWSYSQVVDDLDQLISHAPRREVMLDSVVSLRRHLQSLLLENRKTWNDELIAIRREEMGQDIQDLQNATVEFRRRLENLNKQGEADQILLMSLSQAVRTIEGQALRVDIALDNINTDRSIAAQAEIYQGFRNLQPLVEGLFNSVYELEEPIGSLNLSLDKARSVYRTGRYVILAAFIASVVLLGWLMRCGYRWLFKPIRELYEGSSRVAHGDFNFRLNLDQEDEMGELAESFNKMTIRFQEIKNDLDRQVRERVKQLVRSERLAGIGFLAAGVAHEINTPLTGISMVAESLIMRKETLLSQMPEEDREDLLEDFETLLAESRQCRTITKKLLEFARGEGETRSEVDLTQVINEVIHLVSHLGKYRSYTLTFEHESPCFIEANRSELKQVILNLVANGLEAMDEGGELVVELREETDQVEIKIIDHGSGMTEEVLEHLFEPFFTHAKPGKGTGIGLAITHRIIVDHGGTIEPKSDGPGQGSTFHIHLPRKNAARQAA
ncbi:MAG: HAMP domain-containing histidine kinase [Planctomycetaceae bacterium]|nr:HAMP domain-containing histidine kinase [Planctomycetaceae bacterium]